MGVTPNERDMAKQPLTAEELDLLIGDRPITEFLNTRNELYRERDMKRHPSSREEAIRLMAEKVNLIRRPLLVDGDEIVFGFDDVGYHKMVDA